MSTAGNSATEPATGSGKKELKPQTLVLTLGKLVRTQQFYWFLGHASVLVSFVWYNITSFFSRSLFYYKVILLSVLLTYAIVLRQVHFKSTTGLANLTLLKNNLIRDENTHYFVLALTFYLSSSTLGALSSSTYSFAIFSLFHALTYFQRNLLSSLPISIQKQQVINTNINSFTSNYNVAALAYAATSEILLLTNFVFSIPLLPIRLFTSPFYAIVNTVVFLIVVVFLKLRFDSNKYTQQIIGGWDLKINQLLLGPQSAMIPPVVKDAYQVKFKNFLKVYIGQINTNNIIKLTGGASAPVPNKSK